MLTIYDFVNEDIECDGCGNGHDDSGFCPLCCSSSFAPGSEQCEFCKYYDECKD